MSKISCSDCNLNINCPGFNFCPKMNKKQTKIEKLNEALCQVNRSYYVCIYSPGDGITRYRFFNNPGNTYFGPGDGFYTALGWKEAVVFANGLGAVI